MKVGVPTELTENETRVTITLEGTRELSHAGHEVFLEAGAGNQSAMPDHDYRAAGARIVETADEVWAEADRVAKVELPAESEFDLMRPRQLLFCYLHLAGSRRRAEALLERDITAISYDTVQGWDGFRPIMTSMSEIAGQLAVRSRIRHARRPVANVVVLGADVVGTRAVAMATALDADVKLLDIDPDRLGELEQGLPAGTQTIRASSAEVQDALREADLAIGAARTPTGAAPLVVPSQMAAAMPEGAVLVDVAIDEGGCCEDSRPTTHADPSFGVHGTQFCCIPNLPSAVPQISTRRLTDATRPYLCVLANKGWDRALCEDRSLAFGLNTYRGMITSETVTITHGDPPFDRVATS